MGHRAFKDSRGIEWQAWDVVPQLGDRHAGDRRSGSSVAVTVSGDRRVVSGDRRVAEGRRPVLSAGLGNGWLCFDAQVEKRRLAPIPSDWLRCDEACLERYCGEAKPALRIASALEMNIVAPVRH